MLQISIFFLVDLTPPSTSDWFLQVFSQQNFCLITPGAMVESVDAKPELVSEFKKAEKSFGSDPFYWTFAFMAARRLYIMDSCDQHHACVFNPQLVLGAIKLASGDNCCLCSLRFMLHSGWHYYGTWKSSRLFWLFACFIIAAAKLKTLSSVSTAAMNERIQLKSSTPEMCSSINIQWANL